VRLSRGIAVLAATLVAAVGAVVVAPSASAAEAPTITVSSVCDEATATHTVTWTIVNKAETPATLTGVSVSPPAPISSLSGIAVGDTLPPASQGSLTATATVHSYKSTNTSLRLNLGGSFAYGRSIVLPVCGEPVMPTMTFTSSCEHLTFSVAMPAGGYTLPIETSPKDATQPPLVVEPGAPAQTRTFPWSDPDQLLMVFIPGVGHIATGWWTLPFRCVTPSLGKFQLLAHANYNYLVPGPPKPGSESNIQAIGTGPADPQSQFEFLDAGGGDIAIMHPRGHGLLTFMQDTLHLQWQPFEYVRDSQKFRIVANADGSISLRAKANGKFVTAERAGAGMVYANRTAIGQWEKFTRYAAGKGPRPIYALVNNLLVTAESAGRKPLIANRGIVGHWELFFVEDLGNGNIALKSLVTGKYVCAESAGKKPLVANRAAVGPWETFKLIENADGSQSLRAKVNGRYVTAESAGNKPLIANRTAIGPWEKFWMKG